MYFILSIVLRALYLLLPVGSLGVFALSGRTWLKRTIAGAWISGSVLAGALLGIYVSGIGGHVGYGQIALTIYLGVSLMLLLKTFDHFLRKAILRLLIIDHPDARRRRVVAAGLLRVVLLCGFALPWVMSAAMVYRPRVQPDETPAALMGVDFDDVVFPARDGTRIAGWFVPAERVSRTTVLLCHGLGANKAGMWPILKELHERDLNVLMIDLRAHGFSGGQICTFGARESGDVLGAIDWLKRDRADESQRVVTIGASLGGAAILVAAAEDERIDAVAVIGTFDSLGTLAREISDQRLIPPLSWLTRTLALPMASLHAGVNLRNISPGERINAIWPRPVLVIHGGNDEIIPFTHGQRLYDRAYAPRARLFTGGTHTDVLDDPDVARRLADFAILAEVSPVI